MPTGSGGGGREWIYRNRKLTYLIGWLHTLGRGGGRVIDGWRYGTGDMGINWKSAYLTDWHHDRGANRGCNSRGSCGACDRCGDTGGEPERTDDRERESGCQESGREKESVVAIGDLGRERANGTRGGGLPRVQRIGGCSKYHPKWRGGRFPDLNLRERFGLGPWNGLAGVDRYGRPPLAPSAVKVQSLTIATLFWSEIATRNLTGDDRIAPSRSICSIYGGRTPGGGHRVGKPVPRSPR